MLILERQIHFSIEGKTQSKTGTGTCKLHSHTVLARRRVKDEYKFPIWVIRWVVMMLSLYKRGAGLGEWDGGGGVVELIPLCHDLVEVSEIAKVN